MRRKHGIRTERSEHECQWRWPSCLSKALALICCDMQLYVCVQNSFNADRQRPADAHGLAACFVHGFRGANEREARQKRNRSDSLCCMQRAFRNSAYVRRIQPHSRRLSGPTFLPRPSLIHASENVNKTRCSSLPVSIE